MSTTRTSLLVLSLLAGVTLSVDAYVETRRPLDAAPHLAGWNPAAQAEADDRATPERHLLELSCDAPEEPITQA
jgi:hypothetical protein